MTIRSSLKGVVAAAAGLALLLAGCGSANNPDPESSSITIAVKAIGGQYDPGQGAYMYSSLNINAVYDSLLVQNSESGFDPWLATAFEVSSDRKTLSFTLRDDVNFVDGAHLDADAAVRFFDQMLATESFPFYSKWAEFGLAFEVTGDYTFDVVSERAMDYDLIYGVAVTTPIASPDAITDPDSLSENPVGSGPYLIEDEVADVSITLVRNPDYWNPDAYPFDTVKLVVFADDVAALNGLKSGQVDAAGLNIPLAREAESAGFRLSSAPGRYYALWFADRGGILQPALADVRVRKAINLAFDRESINEAVNLGVGIVSSQPFSPFFPEYVDGGDGFYGFDLAMARELMSDAGYADGFDLVIPTSNVLGLETVTPIVQQSLSELNIRVSYEEIADIGKFIDAMRSGAYAVTLWSEAYVNTMPNYIAPDALFNALNFVDPKAVELYDIVRNGSLDESEAASAELGRYVLEQAWLAPFSAPEIPWASISSVEVDVASGNSGAPYLLNFQTR